MEATFVEQLEGFAGDARLFRLYPPVKWGWDDDKKTEYVVVSAAITFDHGPETYIFPADENGNVVGWLELHGSFQGGLDHDKALRGAGYEVK